MSDTEHEDNLQVGSMAILAACIIIAILALYYASRSINTGGYSLGMAIFGLAVAVAFYMVKRIADHADQRRFH